MHLKNGFIALNFTVREAGARFFIPRPSVREVKKRNFAVIPIVREAEKRIFAPRTLGMKPQKRNLRPRPTPRNLKFRSRTLRTERAASENSPLNRNPTEDQSVVS